MEILFLTYLPEFISVALIAVFVAMSPGSDFVMVARNSMFYGRSAGLYSSVGVALGVWVHVAYSIAGLAIIISNSLLLFSVIKFLGAAYLIYIGWKTVNGHSNMDINNDLPCIALSRGTAFKQGFISNILNPKTTIFFLSLFTQIVNVDTPIFVQLIYGAIISFAHLCWFSLISTVLSTPKLLDSFRRYKGGIEKMVGIALMGFGVKVATTSNQ